jgi:glycosyltransferase involved in cell wall biosynthesis
MSASLPRISAVVCTRNRGASANATIESILANTYPHFEVVIIDQSTNDETEVAVQKFYTDPRFRYIRSDTTGLGRARNIGLKVVTTSLIAYTDDDCTVPPNWLETIVQAFEQQPRVAVIYCNVEAAPYDSRKGFIPAYVRSDNKVVRSLPEKVHARGIGAGLAIRCAPVRELGGFDVLLGAGGMFPSCEDGDITVRAIAKGYWVYETKEVAVTHFGFRTWEQGKALTQRDWVGIGAAYSKLLTCGYWGGLAIITYEGLRSGLFQPLASLLRGGKPQGFRRLIYLAQGVIQGLRLPVDHNTILFHLPQKDKDSTESDVTQPMHSSHRIQA